MNEINEYTSYELSKRLHDKGFAIDNNTHPRRYIVMNDGGENPPIPLSYFASLDYENCIYIPAYTFTELWGAMPYAIPDIVGKPHVIDMWKYQSGRTGASYTRSRGKSRLINIEHESPAEAAGMMVEWLIDNNYLEANNGR